jgi:hypothetical protein
MEQLYHSPLEVYKIGEPVRWVREGHYAALLDRLYKSETMRAEIDGKLAVCQATNTKLAQELAALKMPVPGLAIQAGKCTCTVKTATRRCDNCGKEI